MADDGNEGARERVEDRLSDLDARIAAARARHTPPPSSRADGPSMAEVGWRMVIELTAGIGIGCGIGLGLDSLLGTTPLFLVPFTLIGFAAGVKTMLRSARDLAERNEAGAAPERNERDDDA